MCYVLLQLTQSEITHAKGALEPIRDPGSNALYAVRELSWGMLSFWVLAAWLTVAPAALAVTLTNEYWIDDNVYGSNLGTIADPFIATNATSFDSIMNQVIATSNVVVRLLPGKYLTGGSQGLYGPTTFWLRENTRLLGSGMNVTTIQTVSNAPNNAFVLMAFAGANRVEISDLTVDANGQNASVNKWSNGIYLEGDDCTVRNVRIINLVGDATAPPFGKES